MDKGKGLSQYTGDSYIDYLVSGIVFLLCWLITQIFNPSKVFTLLEVAVNQNDSGYLLASGVVLVLFNSMREIPLNLGWFLLAEGVSKKFPRRHFISWFMPLVAIPGSYMILAFLGKGMGSHFSMPSALSVASVLVLHYLTQEVSGWFNKGIALGLFVFSFRWLNIIPYLTVYGFGWGELSMSLKDIACLLEEEMVLNLSGFLIFISIFFGGIITTQFLVSYSRRLHQLRLLRENEKNLALLREENIRSRGAVELQQLVHDLKRPLTTITGLTDVILSLNEPKQMVKHTSVIAKAAGNMNDMVSEILHAHARRKIHISELVNYTLNQISPFDWKENVLISADQEVLQTQISINLIRLSRALVNLLDNASRAVSTMKEPKIEVSICVEGSDISIIVADNGPGFGSEGYSQKRSGWNSTGIGLGFVKAVIEDHGGEMSISDTVDEGARVIMRFPIEQRS